MSPTADSSLGSANERTEPLLAGGARERVIETNGYIDLMPDDLQVEGITQNLMRSSTVSRIYERWWRPALGRLAKGAIGPGMRDERRIARLLMGLRPGDGVLDVACGPGNFSREFARTVGQEGLVVGIDASRVMLERGVADTRASGVCNLALVYGDATRLPFRDRSFDAVCCFAALHLFDKPLAALDEMTRVLTPRGHIALLTSCRSRSGPVRSFEQLIGASSGMHMFERDEITGALRERGFGHVQQRLSGLTQFVGGRLTEPG